MDYCIKIKKAKFAMDVEGIELGSFYLTGARFTTTPLRNLQRQMSHGSH